MLQSHMFDPDLLAPDGIRKLSRHEYDRLVALGTFEDERVELLRGMLVTMSPQGAMHSKISAWLMRRFAQMLDNTYDVFAHSPFAASEDSEPEPDILIAHASPAFEHPNSALLLIEVAESSLRKDQILKAAIYGDSLVPEYWIVDISGSQLAVHVHTQPTKDGYRHVETLRDGDVLQPTRLPAIEIAIADIPWPR